MPSVSTVVPFERNEEEIPWAAIQVAVAHMIAQPELKIIKGDSWSVYRTANNIRIDIHQ